MQHGRFRLLIVLIEMTEKISILKRETVTNFDPSLLKVHLPCFASTLSSRLDSFIPLRAKRVGEFIEIRHKKFHSPVY